MNQAGFRRRRLSAGVVVLALCAAGLAVIRGPITGGDDRQRPIGAAAGSPRTAAGLVGRAPARARAAEGAPAQRAVDAVLAYTAYLTTASARRREIALTFDDGPGPSTLGILTALRGARAPATFFEVGRAAREYPQIERRVVAAGLPIGDHTETHALLPRLSATAQEGEISQGAQDIQRGGAPAPRLFRPPYGGFTPDTLRLLRSQRMLMVLWTVDTKDFARPGVSRIIYTAVSGARPGAIILFHDGGGDRSQTVAALPRIIVLLRRRHYRLVTVNRLLADAPPSRHQPPPRSLSGR